MKSWLKIILLGIVFAIIAQIVHTIESMATMNFYTDPAYFGLWSKIMMPGQGPPPTEFYIYSIIFSFIAGIIYALIYTMIRKSIPGKTIFNHGLYFGFILFLIGLPSILSLYLLINLPNMLLISWTITALIIDLIFGVIVVKLIK
jgi:hypothetical protein